MLRPAKRLLARGVRVGNFYTVRFRIGFFRKAPAIGEFHISSLKRGSAPAPFTPHQRSSACNFAANSNELYRALTMLWQLALAALSPANEKQ
jgi:hypothetical protein